MISQLQDPIREKKFMELRLLVLCLWGCGADKLGTMLASHLKKPRVYVGCMKSGEVVSDV
jgi:hypothetical protein